ncbi:hypothetical protein MOQ72_24190 [Saccharopolyspora sp. K220]|uniref:hypothetical protein n=1 Tax=Saccharopolyspora soli TaxID=2926618 RepID=UPI001F564158|nr:hypothetical protein [Saccharopolyspora soli]MCI2420555.1 hypothetical protein [Saccharopolyspora soli]
MTAPARAKNAASRTGSNERTQQAAQKTAQKSGPEKPRARSAAAERAYARREERRDRSLREPSDRRPSQLRQGVEERRPSKPKSRPKAKQLQERVSLSRLPLVVVVMSVLATGLAATLWLSIAAVSGSYRLQDGENRINELNERKERLLSDVSSMSSTPEIQRQAEALGMQPAPPPAHLVPQPDGSVLVVGEPKKATAAPPQAPPPVQPPVDPAAPPANAPDLVQPPPAALAGH